MNEAVRELFVDWLQAEVSVIGEWSGDLVGDYRKLIEQGKQRADAVGVPWDDALIPAHVYRMIEADDMIEG
jgi:hypothetical protein